MSELLATTENIAPIEFDLNAHLDRLATGEESLDILVELAKTGEIDPWDINLEEVTDKYLKAITKRNETVHRGDETLREAGQAIFYASVLLRMKSDILTNQANDALRVGTDFDNFADLLDEDLQNIRQVSFRDLERVLRKRNINKIKRFRKVTLEDLLAALQDAKREEEERAIRRAQQRFSFFDGHEIVEPEVSDDMSELTHAENLEEAIQRARIFVAGYLLGRGADFKELVRVLGSWSNAFLAITYLSHEHEVTLEQKELYGDLLIYGSQG